jgi:hypothetical protein
MYMKKGKLRKTASIVAALAIFSAFIVMQSAFAQPDFQTVRIFVDGTIEPASAPIQRNGDIYTLTGDLYGLIIIEKSNIVFDGAGYTVKGTYNGTRPNGWMIGEGPPDESEDTSLWTIGIDLFAGTRPENVTIRNVNIRGFYVGVYVWTTNNTLQNCAVGGNIVGVLLSGDSNTVAENYIEGNDEGVFLGVSTGRLPVNITLTGNSFVENKVQFSGCTCEEYNQTEDIHTWDNGQRGNFWSDYNGTDTNGDGLGDTPYVVDILNQDRFPLIQNALALPAPAAKQPVDAIIISGLAVVTVLVAVAAVYLRKRKKNSASQI